MKLLFHCMLIIIYISTTNTSLYTNNLRKNVIQLLKYQNPSLKPSKKQSFAKAHQNHFRYGTADEDSEMIFDEASKTNIDPIEKYALTDDVTKSTPRILRFKKKSNADQIANNDGGYVLHESKVARNLRISNDDDSKRQEDLADIELAKRKAKIFRDAHQHQNRFNALDIPFSKNAQPLRQNYHMDPVLNILRSHNIKKRLGVRRKADSYSEESTAESSVEEQQWKDEWRHYWGMKKFEAINTSVPPGDTVNMAAARPWGVQCGDPNQHDIPWGQCMLAVECEPEFRIYRGDFFCGRTEFVCCALMLTNYDLYQGIDVSFDDKSLSTDSEQKKHQGLSSERAKRKRKKAKEKRKRERIKRKKKIKKSIQKIVKSIKKTLDNQYKNGTKQRKKKTSMLKKFVKHLKKQYKKDRTSVKDLHEEQMMKIDAALQEKLNQIKMVNEEFMKNETFRDIVVNNRITKTGARMLVQAYPELASYIEATRRNIEKQRRKSDTVRYKSDTLLYNPDALSDKSDISLAKPSNNHYDLEYGYLYE